MIIDEPPLIKGTNYIIIISIILSLINPVFAKEIVDSTAVSYPKETWNTEQLKSILLVISEDFSPKINKNNLKIYGNGSCVPYARYKTGIQLTGWAGNFLDKAEDAGYLISSIPAKGGMIITNESNGHVAVVEEIKEDTIIISEQNYKGRHIVSNRELSLNDPRIQGYIHKRKN